MTRSLRRPEIATRFVLPPAPASPEQVAEGARTALLFGLCLALGFVLLLVRFGVHQLSPTPAERAAMERRFAMRPTHDPAQLPLGDRGLRGAIMDRRGRILAKSWFSSTLVLDPRTLANPKPGDEEAAAREADPHRRALLRRALVRDLAMRIALAVQESGSELTEAAHKDLNERLDVAFGLAARVDGGALETLIPPLPVARLSRWAPVFPKIDATQSLAFERSLRSRGVNAFALESAPERTYPYGSALAQVIGMTGQREKSDPRPEDGCTEIGRVALELEYEAMLAGTAGHSPLTRDRRGRRYLRTDEETVQPTPGHDLELTLDAAVQEIALNAAREGFGTGQMDAVTALVLEARTGDILAMASWPAVEPNAVRSEADLKALACRALTHRFEPGSVIKPLWWARALDQRLTHEDERWACGSPGRTVHFGVRRVEDTSATPTPVTTAEAIIKSKNTAVAELVVRRLGVQGTYDALEAFGILEPLPIAFPGLSKAHVTPREKAAKGGFEQWTGPSLAQGYEIQLSPLAMARLYTAFAGTGEIIEPRLVRAFAGPEGRMEAAPAERRRVISPLTAATMRRILAEVVEEGTGKKLEGLPWTIGAKTGTAVITKSKTESVRRYNLSLVAMAPSQQPEVIVVVNIDNLRRNNTVGNTAGAVAAPIVRRIVQDTLTYLQVPPDRPPEPSDPQVASR